MKAIRFSLFAILFFIFTGCGVVDKWREPAMKEREAEKAANEKGSQDYSAALDRYKLALFSAVDQYVNTNEAPNDIAQAAVTSSLPQLDECRQIILGILHQKRHKLRPDFNPHEFAERRIEELKVTGKAIAHKRVMDLRAGAQREQLDQVEVFKPSDFVIID
jgi:hypothetical protein